MHRGSFPPPNVPQIPETFNYWDGANEGEDEDVDQSEGTEGNSQEDSESGGSSSLHYAAHEMDEREARFYLEMYDT